MWLLWKRICSRNFFIKAYETSYVVDPKSKLLKCNTYRWNLCPFKWDIFRVFDHCVNLLFIICLALQLDCFKNGCHSCYNKNVPSIMFWCFLGLTLLLWSSLTGLEKAFWWTKPHPPPRSHKVVSWKAFRAEGGFLNAFPGLKLQKNWQMLAAADNFNSDGTTVYYRDTRRVAETWKSTGVSRWVDIPCRVTGVSTTIGFHASNKYHFHRWLTRFLKLKYEISDDKITWNW